MIHELLYTSHSGKGLRQGSGGGFCTVLSTQGMANNLAMTLERMSGYRHPFDLHDPRSKQNPVNYRVAKIRVGGITYHVLSRIADMREEHTGRTNKLAHHLAVQVDRLPLCGPSWVLSQSSAVRKNWDGDVRVVNALSESIFPQSDLPLGVCQNWKKVAGDAGWAGEIADWMLEQRGKKPISIIVPSGTDALALTNEIFSLLPSAKRWEFSFSTYFTSLAPGTTCDLRFVLNETREAEQVRRDKTQKLIDTSSLTSQPDSTRPLVAAARSGKIVHERVKPATPRRSKKSAGRPLLVENDEPALEVIDAGDALQLQPPEPARKNQKRRSRKSRDREETARESDATDRKKESKSRSSNNLLKFGAIGFVVMALFVLFIAVGIGIAVVANFKKDPGPMADAGSSGTGSKDGASKEPRYRKKEDEVHENGTLKGGPNGNSGGGNQQGKNKPEQKGNEQNSEGKNSPDGEGVEDSQKNKQGKGRNGGGERRGGKGWYRRFPPEWRFPNRNRRPNGNKNQHENRKEPLKFPEFLDGFITDFNNDRFEASFPVVGLNPDAIESLEIIYDHDIVPGQSEVIRIDATNEWEISYAQQTIGKMVLSENNLTIKWTMSEKVRENASFQEFMAALKFFGLLVQLKDDPQPKFIPFLKPKKSNPVMVYHQDAQPIAEIDLSPLASQAGSIFKFELKIKSKTSTGPAQGKPEKNENGGLRQPQVSGAPIKNYLPLALKWNWSEPYEVQIPKSENHPPLGRMGFELQGSGEFRKKVKGQEVAAREKVVNVKTFRKEKIAEVEVDLIHAEDHWLVAKVTPKIGAPGDFAKSPDKDEYWLGIDDANLGMRIAADSDSDEAAGQLRAANQARRLIKQNPIEINMGVYFEFKHDKLPDGVKIWICK